MICRMAIQIATCGGIWARYALPAMASFIGRANAIKSSVKGGDIAPFLATIKLCKRDFIPRCHLLSSKVYRFRTARN